IWSRSRVNGREQIALEQGQLRISVPHGARSPALRVLLPDGELEDTGTVFSVSVTGGHTQSVAVEQGSVLLRLREHEPIALGAGQAWTDASAPNQSPLPAPSPSAVPRVEPPIASQRAVPVPPASVASRAASEDFRSAVAALSAGQNAAAAGQLARFLRSYPHDARAEDAAYLRVLALGRAGDARAMQSA